MKYLIIGGTSAFGKAVTVELFKGNEKPELLVMTKLPTENCADMPGVTWQNLDLMNPLMITELLTANTYDVIYHFAVQNSVSYAWENPSATIDVNVSGTLNLLDAVRQCGYTPRIVIASSGEEYGQVPFSEIPIREETVVSPKNLFAASKNCQTMIAELYGKAYHMDILILRVFNEIGPGQSERFVVSNLCKQFALNKLRKNEPVIYAGNTNVRRDFTDIRDIARAFVVAAEKGTSGQIYNVGKGHAISIMDVISILEKVSGLTVQVRSVGDRMRLIDTPIFEANCSKIQKELGWVPEITREQTIKDMYQYWLDELSQ